MLSTIQTLLTSLQRDAARYRHDWYRKGGFWIGATYRLGAAARDLPAPLRIPVQVPYRAANFVWRTLFNVHISDRAKIGAGLWLVHATNILIPETEIGDNATIFHDVTIGTNLHPDVYPRIGSHVEIYVGARVLGGVDVGDNARIGANCVVTTDVQPGAIVVPAVNRVVRSPTPGHLDRFRQAWGGHAGPPVVRGESEAAAGPRIDGLTGLPGGSSEGGGDKRSSPRETSFS